MIRRRIVNGLYIGLILFGTIAGMVISILVFDGLTPLPSKAGNLIMFTLLFGVTYFSLRQYSDRLGKAGVLGSVLSGFSLVTIPKMVMSGVEFNIGIIPTILLVLLAVFSAYRYHYSSNKRVTNIVIPLIYPLALTFGLQGWWYSKVAYASVYENVDMESSKQFEFESEGGKALTSEQLRGKIVLFDFWFISCPQCWAKFPELERMHQKYGRIEDVELYAVNRPMSRDKPEECFEVIREKDYTFPVVKAEQGVIDDFGVKYYPTVVVLNREGRVIYFGDHEGAELKVDSMMNMVN